MGEGMSTAINIATTLIVWAIPLVYFLGARKAIGNEDARRQGAFWGMAAATAVVAMSLPMAFWEASKDMEMPAMAGTVFLGAILAVVMFIGLKIAPTILAYKAMRREKANSVALGVAALAFVNPVSGILLLCSKKDARGLGAEMPAEDGSEGDSHGQPGHQVR